MICLVVGYLVCAFICYGLFFANLQGEFPSASGFEYKEQMASSAIIGILAGFFGPIGILMVILMTGFAQHGFKVK